MSSLSQNRQELLDALLDAGQELGMREVMFHSAVADRAGLGVTDHKALAILAEEGPLTAGELAERIGLTTGSITGLLDRLEAAGYAARVRDSRDRRRVIVKPHVERARKKFGPLFERFGSAVAALHDGYDEAELTVLLDYLGRLNSVLREETRRLRGEESRDSGNDR